MDSSNSCLPLTSLSHIYKNYTGCGWYGRCGIGDNSGHLLVPEKIDALSGERTVGLAAGSAHSLVLTASGKVHKMHRTTEEKLLDATF